MFVAGKANKKALRLIQATHDALMLGIEQVKPGNTFGDIGAAIQGYIEPLRMSVVRDFCGHGLGRVFHAPPNVLHYGKLGSGPIIEPGMFFTIEPMVNMGSWKDTHWLDGWTAVTKDGLPSAQFEHTLLVTETGCEILTKRLETSPPLWWEAEAAERGAAGASSAPPVPIDDPD